MWDRLCARCTDLKQIHDVAAQGDELGALHGADLGRIGARTSGDETGDEGAQRRSGPGDAVRDVLDPRLSE